jgi:hypothetical protein
MVIKLLLKEFLSKKNEYYGNDWVVDVPVNKNNFKYSHTEMKEKSVKPYFVFEKDEDKRIIIEKNNKKNIIKFNNYFF